jgi:O-antigen/teichoic acid export membrane protein|tara:strand:- start:327 stop:1655 length:1329 start_codon:yes stop_codon:yes gene_type:complete
MPNFFALPGFRKYFANTSWLLGERVLRMVVSLFVGIYVARYLGPERFGLLSYTLSFVWLFSSLASFGLDEILVRELVKSPEQRNNLLGTVFWLKVCGTLVMGTTIALVLKYTVEDQQTYWMIALITFGFLFQATNVVDFYFQSQVQSKFAVRAQAIQLILTSLFKIYLVWNQAELIWFAFALMLDQAVVAVLFLLVYHWKIGWFPFFSFRWKQAKKLMRDAWPLIFAGMVVSVYMKIDQVMLKEMLDVKAVGVYAAAVKLCEAWYFLPTALIASLFPAVIEAKIKSKTLYDKRVQNLYDLMVWSSIAVALPTTLLADWVILILYGTDFQEAADVLRIYIWAGVFVTLGIASSKWLIAENLQRYLFLRTILGALLNVGFNLWLIPIYGIKGAAIATLVAQGTASFLSLSFFKKTRHNFLFAAKSLSIYGAYKRTFQKIIIRGR